MAELTSSARTALPDSAFACPETRKYPHHRADGSIDLPHLRNALARIADPSNDQCGKGHLMAHAKAEGIGESKAEPLDDVELEVWFAGKRPRALRAIPFGGPIKGRDLDGEFFSRRTDIKADWFESRPVLWHHGGDRLMGTTVLGKATDLRMEDDGWWVDLWLKAGEKRLGLVRALAERGAALYGSSQSLAPLVRKANTGEILVWPYVEQTLSTSPQNTYSILRAAKAVADFDAADIALPGVLRGLLGAIDDLGSDLTATYESGERPAKAGRVLSSRNLSELAEALEMFETALAKVRTVHGRGIPEVDAEVISDRIERALNA